MFLVPLSLFSFEKPLSWSLAGLPPSVNRHSFLSACCNMGVRLIASSMTWSHCNGILLGILQHHTWGSWLRSWIIHSVAHHHENSSSCFFWGTVSNVHHVQMPIFNAILTPVWDGSEETGSKRIHNKLSLFLTFSFYLNPTIPHLKSSFRLLFHTPTTFFPPPPLRLWLCSCLGVVCGASGQDHITLWRPQTGYLWWVLRGDKGPEEPWRQDQVL